MDVASAGLGEAWTGQKQELQTGRAWEILTGHNDGQAVAEAAENVALLVQLPGLAKSLGKKCVQNKKQILDFVRGEGTMYGGARLAAKADAAAATATAAAAAKGVAPAAGKFPNCFPAGTVVGTEHGPRPIQDVRAEDRVWAFDLITGEWKLRRVMETYRHDHDGDVVAATVAGEVVESTGHHPWWVVRGEGLGGRPQPEHVPGNPAAYNSEGRWVDAIDLRVGDVLLLRSGEQAAITEPVVRHARQPVYNFHVEELHCYAVGHAQILVHNNSGSATVADVSGWLRNEPPSNLIPQNLRYFRDELKGPNHLYVWAEPIEVFVINGQKYVLNGHHRLTAAADVGYTGSIPYRTITEAEMLQSYNTTPAQLLQGHYGPIK